MLKRFGALLSVIALLFIVSHSQPNVAYAQNPPRFCNLALVLGMDASSSVNSREYALQMKGMASALLDQRVKEAILAMGGIYLAAFEWNGRLNQKLLFNWTWLDNERDIFKTASLLANHERNSINSPTAIGHALAYASFLYPTLPEPCARHVLDVSGDGINNEGYSPQIAYRNFNLDNVTVNGLVIQQTGVEHDKFYGELESYYNQQIIKGPGAFVLVADSFENFEDAMTQKLLKEITPGPIGQLQ